LSEIIALMNIQNKENEDKILESIKIAKSCV